MIENNFGLKLEKNVLSDREVKSEISSLLCLFKEKASESLHPEDKKFEIDDFTISLSMKEIDFSTDTLPNNHDELLDSKLSRVEKGLIEFLDFYPNDYYKLRNFRIENSDGSPVFDLLSDAADINVYIRKQGSDPSGSEVKIANDDIKMEIEPNCLAGILALLHEVGHKKDPKLDLLEMYEISINGPKKQVVEKVMNLERNAWSYALGKLRNFIKQTGYSQKEINAFIHQWSLGSYSIEIEKYLAQK